LVLQDTDVVIGSMHWLSIIVLLDYFYVRRFIAFQFDISASDHIHMHVDYGWLISR